MLDQYKGFFEAIIKISSKLQKKTKAKNNRKRGYEMSRSLLKTLLLVLDTETTGLSEKDDQIIELGGCYFYEAKKVGDILRSRAKPSIPIPPNSTNVHGITDADVAECPPWSAVSQWLKKHLDAGPLICGYNFIGFDMKMINAENARHGLSWRIQEEQVLDLLIFARWYHPEVSNRLSNIGELYGIILPEHKAHSADADSLATGMLANAMILAGTIPIDPKIAISMQKEISAQMDDDMIKYGKRIYIDRNDRSILRIAQGIHRGKSLKEIEESYADILLEEPDPKEITEHAKELIRSFFKKQINLF
jgi:DNA polymerase-3 subunit epsilon